MTGDTTQFRDVGAGGSDLFCGGMAARPVIAA
jgi:hypothetical protein